MTVYHNDLPVNRNFDFIVCGGGTAGGVVAARLAANPDVQVLLLEAGGDERVEVVTDSRLWMKNIGGERDWQFRSQPCAALNGRTPPLPMGKVLGGGSSTNGLIWARGHRSDFDNWAEATGDDGWNYASVLQAYQRIERWQGPADPQRRGTDGPFEINLPTDPNPVAIALAEAAQAYGIERVEDLNGAAMEGEGASGIPNVAVTGGSQRVSVASAYLRPAIDQPNLTVVLGAMVEQVILEDRKAVGVRIHSDGQHWNAYASLEVVLSLGAINTPKLLMVSGIGPSTQLAAHDIECVQHLPGIGQNFQDHILVAGCVWEYQVPQAPRNNSAEFTFFWKSAAHLPAPDLQPVLEECAFGSEVTRAQYALPADPSLAWTLAPGLVRPHSRGQLLLGGRSMSEPLRIEANFLSDERDVTALLRAIEICRDLGNSSTLAPFVKRELMPGPLKGEALVRFLRDAAGTYFHQTCTAKMGRDEMSVVDGQLKVYGIDRLRIADGSVMPDITTGNTMAPCVMIGERAAQMLIETHW
ncbi:GMC family oxidoreductase [Pseudomonas sp. LS-2]|uniref:GMC family oxidoreductase n=1 Tax=Pseudomonas sp. LS-2 TaxID=2315859 RepID=UPI000E737D73|nr:GMC family oxidoreductase N-terminal domain-containing protein [Pseudomonas sp. LS-2]RJX77837.1 GMC family oxidoreductase [Pseudomonas sp. LS-2]